MTLLAVASGKGSPGTTTAALLLAAVWPRPTVLAELDPAGGDLALRLRGEEGRGLREDVGLLSLAVAVRRGATGEVLREHTQTLAGGQQVLSGLASAEQALGLRDLWSALATTMATVPDGDVVADCGRLGAGASVLPVLAAADLVALVVRPTIDGVAHLRTRVASLAEALNVSHQAPIAVIVVTDARDERSVGEVQQVIDAAHLPARVAGRLALDAKAAATLRGEWGPRLDRSLLVRSARELALILAGAADAVHATRTTRAA